MSRGDAAHLKDRQGNVSVITGLKVPFGERENQLFTPTEVDSGLACQCICPGCGGRLAAKNAGNKKTPHFAHHSPRSDIQNCVETAVHKMAKQIIDERRQLYLPALWLPDESATDLDGNIHTEQACAIVAGLAELDRVRIEPQLDPYRPDAQATAYRIAIYIEIVVTHGVAGSKAHWYRDQGVPVLGLFLGKVDRTVTKEQLTNWLMNGDYADWINGGHFSELRAAQQDRLSERIRRISAQIAAARELTVQRQLREQQHLAAISQRKQAFLEELRELLCEKGILSVPSADLVLQCQDDQGNLYEHSVVLFDDQELTIDQVELVNKRTCSVRLWCGSLPVDVFIFGGSPAEASHIEHQVSQQEGGVLGIYLQPLDSISDQIRSLSTLNKEWFRLAVDPSYMANLEETLSRAVRNANQGYAAQLEQEQRELVEAKANLIQQFMQTKHAPIPAKTPDNLVLLCDQCRHIFAISREVTGNVTCPQCNATVSS